MKLNSDPLLLKVYTNFNYCYIQKIVIIACPALVSSHWLKLIFKTCKSVVKKQSSSSTI
jgi:hypothetical protein